MLNHMLSSRKGDEGQVLLDNHMILALVTVIVMGAIAFLGGYFSTTLAKFVAPY